MIAKANFKVGGVVYQFEVEEKDEIDTLHKIIVLTNPPRRCGECGNIDKEKFYLTTNKDQEGNTYVNLKCVCGARSKLGQYKSGGFFWHKFEKWEKKLEVFEEKNEKRKKSEV